MLVDNFSVSIFAFYFTNESCNRATTAFEKSSSTLPYKMLLLFVLYKNKAVL